MSKAKRIRAKKSKQIKVWSEVWNQMCKDDMEKTRIDEEEELARHQQEFAEMGSDRFGK